MLKAIAIRNFAIVRELDIELAEGMTVITGETGAGKSIMLDALALALGDRTDSGVIAAGADRADITATMDITRCATAQGWLLEHELANGDECLLRRVITRDGRSRGFINGQPVTLQQLQTLGEMLIDIHSQHEHQSLLNKDTHRRLLDEFAGSTDLATQVKEAFTAWQHTRQALTRLRENAREHEDRLQLLRYQVEELEQLGLSDGELAQLEQEQHLLANAEQLINTDEQLLQVLSDDDTHNTLHGLQHALHLLDDNAASDPRLASAREMIDSARIQIEEACIELRNHQHTIDINPARLRLVEERLTAVYNTARKHRLAPAQLWELTARLSEELAMLTQGGGTVEQLTLVLEQQAAHYTELSRKLTTKRRKAAKTMSAGVNEQLARLGMERSVFSVELMARDSELPAANGAEQIEFMVSTNPGQPAKPLRKIASGGELSRISLAIQVIAAQHTAIPTLVFDEVDAGIGGATANVVGELLRKLGEKGQVICVTHLAQVAACAHQHLRVSKGGEESVYTTLESLNEKQRVDEVARMISGALTKQSRLHAAEILALQHS